MAARTVPEGYHQLTPYLVVRDAACAIEFYKEVFNAEVLLLLDEPGGKIAHSELRIGDSRILLADEFPERGARSPRSLGGSPVCLLLYVEDVDTVARKAISAGAVMVDPIQDHFYGDRSGNFVDPFGHLWTIATHKENLAPEEIRQRLEQMVAATDEKVDS